MALLEEDDLEIPDIKIEPLGVADQLGIENIGKFVKN